MATISHPSYHPVQGFDKQMNFYEDASSDKSRSSTCDEILKPDASSFSMWGLRSGMIPMLTGNINGSAEYIETQNLSTSALGLVNTIFGTGTASSGTYADIEWTSGSKFLKVEVNTGSGFVEVGRQQLWTSPYAEHSRTSSAIKNQALPVFDNNAAALAGGLQAGDMYRRLNGDLKIVY